MNLITIVFLIHFRIEFFTLVILTLKWHSSLGSEILKLRRFLKYANSHYLYNYMTFRLDRYLTSQRLTQSFHVHIKNTNIQYIHTLTHKHKHIFPHTNRQLNKIFSQLKSLFSNTFCDSLTGIADKIIMHSKRSLYRRHSRKFKIVSRAKSLFPDIIAIVSRRVSTK